MKLNKPVITICLIIVLVINLLFFLFLSIGNNLSNKEYVGNIIREFDFKTYLLDNQNINSSLERYRYPKEVFSYLDDIKISEIKEEIINNLFDSKHPLFDKKEVIDVLLDSVHEFESNRNEDIYSYVFDDINAFADQLDRRVNNDFTDAYYFAKKITSSLYLISIIVSIILMGYIIIVEKTNGFLIDALVMFIYSFFVYYFNKNFLTFVYKNLLKYFNKIEMHLDGLYLLCFILGIILLLIYIVRLFRKAARDIRISSYNRR